MSIDFIQMMKENQKLASEKESQKDEEISRQHQKTSDSLEIKEKIADKDDAKKESMPVNGENYRYPFSLYTEGHTVDISEYGFEDGRSYTPKQICDIMLQHRHYEFAGNMTFKMFDDDNMLVATAKQYKKG